MSALTRACAWLVEPAEELPTLRTFPSPAVTTPERSPRLRPLVAVVGLAPGCGSSTLARALGAALARRDHSGTAIVAGADPAPANALATRAATRLVARLGPPARAAGRLCLTHDFDPAHAQLAPLVFETAVPAADAQLTILIAVGDSEPALAELAARAHARALTVVTYTADSSRWDERAFLLLPRPGVSARLAAAGWEPRGAFGAAVARLANACEEAACG